MNNNKLLEQYQKMYDEYISNSAVHPRFIWLNYDDYYKLKNAANDYYMQDFGGIEKFRGAELRPRKWVKERKIFFTFNDLENIEELTQLSPLYSAYDMVME